MGSPPIWGEEVWDRGWEGKVVPTTERRGCKCMELCFAIGEGLVDNLGVSNSQ